MQAVSAEVYDYAGKFRCLFGEKILAPNRLPAKSNSVKPVQIRNFAELETTVICGSPRIFGLRRQRQRLSEFRNRHFGESICSLTFAARRSSGSSPDMNHRVGTTRHWCILSFPVEQISGLD